MTELLEEIRQHDADGTDAMNHNNKQMAEIFFRSAHWKLRDAYSHFILKDHSSQFFYSICQLEELINEKIQKLNSKLEEEFFSEIFSMDSTFYTYSYIDDQLIKVEPNQNNYRLQIFLVNQTLKTDKNLEMCPEIVLIAAGHLHLLSKMTSISTQISTDSFTVFTTCNEGNVFTLTFDAESECGISQFKKILTNYSNYSANDESHKILYQLSSGVQLEIESQLAFSDASFQLILEDNTLIIKVADFQYPLFHLTIRKPKSRSFLIKEYSVLIRFPSSVAENEIILLEDLICELTSFEIPEKFPSFFILLQLMTEIENLQNAEDFPSSCTGVKKMAELIMAKDDDPSEKKFEMNARNSGIENNLGPSRRSWTDKIASAISVILLFMESNVKKNSKRILKVLISPHFITAVLNASRMNFQGLVSIGLREILTPVGQSMIAELPVLMKQLEEAIKD